MPLFGDSDEAPAVGAPVDLAAPSRPGLRRARPGARPRRGMVPVGGGKGSKADRRQLLEALLQGWQPRARVPAKQPGEREVKF